MSQRGISQTCNKCWEWITGYDETTDKTVASKYMKTGRPSTVSGSLFIITVLVGITVSADTSSHLDLKETRCLTSKDTCEDAKDTMHVPDGGCFHCKAGRKNTANLFPKEEFSNLMCWHLNVPRDWKSSDIQLVAFSLCMITQESAWINCSNVWCLQVGKQPDARWVNTLNRTCIQILIKAINLC